jgi:long-subunit acyl-CoA synthetase (AMP-forming)
MAWRDGQDGADPGADPQLAIAGDDVVLQLYTSATRGHPKGAQIAHDNIFATLQATGEFYSCTTDDVSLACMPHTLSAAASWA